MSYLGTALQRCAERRGLSQSDIARQSRVSRSYISRLCSGGAHELSDANFIAILNVFAADPQTQAEITAARCMDARVGPAAGRVEISVKSAPAQTIDGRNPNQYPVVEVSHETEKAFAWLRSQCPINPDLEKHLVGYARLTGMK